MRLFFSLFAVLLIGACSSTPEPVNKPAELTDIENPIRVKVLWQESSGVGSKGQHVRLQPAISNDRIWTIDIEGLLIAHDRSNGRQIWKRQTGLPVSGAIGYGEDLLLVGTRDAKLVALSAETGVQRWSHSASSEILSVPVVESGLVVAQTGDGHLFAVSVKDGSKVWEYSRNLPLLTLRGTASPSVRDSRVYAGFADGKVVAIGLNDGRVFWERTISIPSGRTEVERLVDIDVSPAAIGGEVFVVGYQGNMASLFGATGDRLWNRAMSAYSGLTLGTDQLYLADSKDHLWSLDRNNGASLWKQDKLQGRKLGGTALLGQYLVVGDFEGYLHLLRDSDGKLSARTQLGDSGFTSAPQVIEDRLYIYTANGTLVALKLADRTD